MQVEEVHLQEAKLFSPSVGGRMWGGLPEVGPTALQQLSTYVDNGCGRPSKIMLQMANQRLGFGKG